MEEGPACAGRESVGSLAVCALSALMLCLAVAWLAFPAAADNRRAASSPHVRQLATPYHPLARNRLKRRVYVRDGRPYLTPPRTPSLARSVYSSQLARSRREQWHRYRPFDAQGTLGRGPRKTLSMRTAPLSREIVVDQLLALPRADGDGDDRLQSLRAAGIPVFRDVPPIVIINPPRAERDRFGTPLMYPAR